MQTVIGATQKETATDQQQRSCETLICQHHQTILRLLSSAATASTGWPVRELYCLTTYLRTVTFALYNINWLVFILRWRVITAQYNLDL